MFPRFFAIFAASTLLALTVFACAACEGAGAADNAAHGSLSASPSGSPGALRVTDPAGRIVRVDAPARRVTSMVPAMTEWIVAIGAGDRLVARTDYDAQPALAALPSMGGGLDPSVEWLTARHPDLVVAWPDAPGRSLVARLKRLGIPVYTAPVQTVDAALVAARDLGRLLGEDSAADATVSRVRAGLDSVRAATADGAHPSVLFVIGLDPLMAAGPGTFIGELLGRAGARNVLADAPARWPTISLEEAVARKPDVIVLATAGEGAAPTDGGAAPPDPAGLLRDRPGWRDLPAVRRGRVCAVDPYFVNRPGPHMADAAALLAACIHEGRR